MAYTPLAGSGGRIRTGAGSTICAFLNKWNVVKSVGVLAATTFESAVDANSVIHRVQLSDNLCGSKFTVEGYWDADTTNSEAVFPIGTSVTTDFLLNKTSSLGYHNIACIVQQIETGPQLEGASTAVPFKAMLEATGVVAPAAVS